MNTKSCQSVGWTQVALLWLAVVNAAAAQSGVPLWTNRYNGPANGPDYAAAVVVAGNSNIFITGFSGATNVSPYLHDYATVAYSGEGVPLWTNRFNGTGNHIDLAYAAAVDSSNNVIVTGTTASAGTGSDFATLQYSSAGVPLWTNRYNGPVNGGDQANAVAADGSNNIVVTGTSPGTNFLADYATIKYSSAGVPLWTNRYNGPTNGIDSGLGVAVDVNGNVVVTGYSSNGGSDDDYATVAYSSAGVPLWTNRFNGPGIAPDQANAVAVDSSSNVFVTGYSYDAGFISTDFATVAYSGAGVPLWTNRYNGPSGAFDYGRAVVVDGGGNVIVTGESASGTGGNDYATIKYSGAGVPLWTNRYNGPASLPDYPTAVAVDSGGNVFVHGRSRGSSSLDDFATVAYSSAGLPLWTNRYNGPTNAADGPQYKSCLAIGPDGAVHVAGESAGNTSSATTPDYAVLKFSGIPSLSPIPLAYQVVGNQIVLSWSNVAFGLQTAPLVQGTYTNISGAASPYTNDLSEPQRYYRLKGN